MNRKTVYWIVTAITALASTITGMGLLLRLSHFATDMAHLGYPAYFLSILGTWKVLGGLAIAAPRLSRLKEWAYAGMIFDTTGAAISHVIMADGVAKIAGPLFVAVLVFLSWWFRPADRRLSD